MKAILFALLLPLSALAQRFDYPMRIETERPGGPLELIGGNPDFLVRSLESDFGVGVESYTWRRPPGEDQYTWSGTQVRWSKIINPEWSNAKITLTIWYTFNHPDEEYTDFDSITYTSIECKDTNGKDLLEEKSKSVKLIYTYLKEKLFRGFAFVNSTNGINVRKEANVNSPIVYRIKDQTKVILKEETTEWTEIARGDSVVRAQWIKIYINRNISGYVLNTFLIPWDALHPAKVYDSFHVSYGETETKKWFNYSTNPYVYEMGEYRQMERKPNPDYKAAWKDTLTSHMTIELVNIDSYKNKKITSPYALDTRKIGIPTKPTSGYVSDSSHSIKLPINGGKDFLHIQDQPNEYSERNEYVGRIPIADIYVIDSYSFGQSYVFYDVKTGKQSEASFTGIPYFSSDGKYAISFSHSSDPEIFDRPHTCSLSITEFGKGFKVKNTFSVEIYAWLPSEKTNSAFWISDRELIIPVVSASSSFSPEATFRDYVKVTIR